MRPSLRPRAPASVAAREVLGVVAGGYREGWMPHHLEPVPDLSPDEEQWLTPAHRPPWWRWVAIAVILALVVATPFAYALHQLLR